MSDKTPLLLKVSKIPPATRRKRQPIYQAILETLATQPAGTYKVNMPNKKANTIITSLNRQIKQYHLKGISLYKRGNSVYIKTTEDFHIRQLTAIDPLAAWKREDTIHKH